jgi:hypothetical protein
MQTLSRVNRLGLVSLLFVCTNTYAALSNGQVTYDLVDRNGVPFNNAEAHQTRGMLFRQTRPNGTFIDFRIPEFDSMKRKHNFEFYLLDDSLISSPQGDYFVVESMRSIAMNPEEDKDYVNHRQWWEHRCDHGVHLTYLVSVVKKKISIVKKYFTQCTSEAKVIHDNGQIGYEVKTDRAPEGTATVYLLQENGKFIKKINKQAEDVH